MTVAKALADQIRELAVAGADREEIGRVTGAGRYCINDALNRPLARDFGALPVPTTDGCDKCGAAPFEAEPSRVGKGRHCGKCGAHYTYWESRRRPVGVRNSVRVAREAERKAEVAAWLAERRRPGPPTKVDAVRAAIATGAIKAEVRAMTKCTRQMLNYALIAPLALEDRKPPGGGRPRKKHCSGCGSEPARQHPEHAGRFLRGQRCMLCGAMKSAWMLDDPDRTGSPWPSGKPCVDCGAPPNRQRPLLVGFRPPTLVVRGGTQRSKAAVRGRRCEVCETCGAAWGLSPVLPAPWVELPVVECLFPQLPDLLCDRPLPYPCSPYIGHLKRKTSLASRLEQPPKRKDKRAPWCERIAAFQAIAVDRNAFESAAWNRHAVKGEAGRTAAREDAADEWLRKHEARRAPAQLEPPPTRGVLSYGMGPTVKRLSEERPNYRAEIRAAAAAGDEYAQDRAWCLFDEPDE